MHALPLSSAFGKLQEMVSEARILRTSEQASRWRLGAAGREGGGMLPHSSSYGKMSRILFGFVQIGRPLETHYLTNLEESSSPISRNRAP